VLRYPFIQPRGGKLFMVIKFSYLEDKFHIQLDPALKVMDKPPLISWFFKNLIMFNSNSKMILEVSTIS